MQQHLKESFQKHAFRILNQFQYMVSNYYNVFRISKCNQNQQFQDLIEISIFIKKIYNMGGSQSKQQPQKNKPQDPNNTNLSPNQTKRDSPRNKIQDLNNQSPSINKKNDEIKVNNSIPNISPRRKISNPIQQNQTEIIERKSLEKKLSQYKNDNKSPLILGASGTLILNSYILDVRFNRRQKCLQKIRNPDNYIESEVSWVFLKDKNIYQIHLIDKSMIIDKQQIQLKDLDIVFYATRTGEYIGLRSESEVIFSLIGENVNPTSTLKSTIQQLQYDLKILWRNLIPTKQKVPDKIDIYIAENKQSEQPLEFFEKMYDFRNQMTILQNQKQIELWQIKSNQRKKKRIIQTNKNETILDINKEDKILTKSRTVLQQRYCYSQNLLPFVLHIDIKNKLVARKDEGYLIDIFEKKYFIQIIRQEIKASEKIQQFVTEFEKEVKTEIETAEEILKKEVNEIIKQLNL